MFAAANNSQRDTITFDRYSIFRCTIAHVDRKQADLRFHDEKSFLHIISR